MPNFTAGTSFGANDTVTNTKLDALIADASINPEYAINLNSGTIGTLSCTKGTIPTLVSTTGTIATINSTTGNIGAVVATSVSATSGTVQTLTASTLSGTLTGGTYSGSLGTSCNFTAGTVQTLTAGTLTGTLTGGTYSGTFSGSLGTSCNFTAGTIGTFTATNNATIAGVTSGTKGSSLAFSNTLFGNSSLTSHTSGDYCTCVGYNSSVNNTTGSNNSIFGANSSYSNKTGSDNSSFGFYSLFSSGTAQSRNSAFGSNALYSSSGSANTAIGYLSLGTCIYNNCTGVGANAAITAGSQVQLGDSNTTTYAYGAVQNRSDIRDKADVRDTELGLQFVNQLRPVDFKWDMREFYRTYSTETPYKLSDITHDGSKKRNRYHHGLIAQEVKEVLDKNGIDFGGFQDHKINGGDDVLSIGYTELIAPMIKAIQQLSAKVDILEAQLANK